MRVIEVKSCRECPYRYAGDDPMEDKWDCWCVYGEPKEIDPRTKTFPKFCPLKEAKS